MKYKLFITNNSFDNVYPINLFDGTADVKTFLLENKFPSFMFMPYTKEFLEEVFIGLRDEFIEEKNRHEKNYDMSTYFFKRNKALICSSQFISINQNKFSLDIPDNCIFIRNPGTDHQVHVVEKIFGYYNLQQIISTFATIKDFQNVVLNEKNFFSIFLNMDTKPSYPKRIEECSTSFFQVAFTIPKVLRIRVSDDEHYYQIIDGFSTIKAAIANGVKEIPMKVLNV